MVSRQSQRHPARFDLRSRHLHVIRPTESHPLGCENPRSVSRSKSPLVNPLCEGLTKSHNRAVFQDPYQEINGYSKSKVAREFELQTIRRAFQTRAGALIVDDEEIAVWAIDVAEAHIDE